MPKPHGEPHVSNTAQGKHWLGHYDGHERMPGAAKAGKRARSRWRRRKEHQTIEQMRSDIEAIRTHERRRPRYDAPDPRA